MSTATTINDPLHHVGWDSAGTIRSTAISWCEKLWCYLGRPIALERVSATPRVDGDTEVTVALGIVAADRANCHTHMGLGTDNDVDVATARAVVQAVGRADPFTVPLWNLDTLGHIVAATVVDGPNERPSVGPETEVERLRHLLGVLRPRTQISVRTRHGTYRAIDGSDHRLALSVVDRPESLAAVGEWLRPLSPSTTGSS